MGRTARALGRAGSMFGGVAIRFSTHVWFWGRLAIVGGSGRLGSMLCDFDDGGF